jgi:energy-coupling factor transporter transmembrane protein EcfT
MVDSPRSQVWVAIASAGLIGQVLVMFLVDPGWVPVTTLGIAALVGAFLLRGSRVAWSIAAVSAGGQLVEAIFANQPLWIGILNAAVLGCLFVPASIRFVWRKGQPDARSKALSLGRMQQGTHEFLYRGLAVAAGWETSFNGESHGRTSKSYRTLIWRLGLLTLLMLLFVGLTYSWQQETGDDVVPNVVADVAWTSYAVMQVALLVVVSLAVIRHFSSSRSDAAQGS